MWSTQPDSVQLVYVMFHVSWFQVDFSWFQVGFHGSRSVVMVFHGSRLVFHGGRSAFVVFHGSGLVLH